jgi:hypothetical protein
MSQKTVWLMLQTFKLWCFRLLKLHLSIIISPYVNHSSVSGMIAIIKSQLSFNGSLIVDLRANLGVNSRCTI